MATNDVTIAGASEGTRISGPLLPHRDDEVVVWLREQRRQYEGSPAFASGYNAIDGLLDDYKLRADLGKSLSDVISPATEPF